MTAKQPSTPYLVRICHTVYRQFGSISAQYPWTVIHISLIFTGLMTLKVATTPEVSGMDGYASDTARSKVEFNSFQQFLNSDGIGLSLGVLIRAKDNGSMIRSAELAETVQIIDLIGSHFPMFNSENGKNETFDEFCYGFCQANEPVRQFYNGMQIVSSNDTDPVSQRIHLAYPTSSMFGREFSLLPNYFGVEVNKDGTLQSVNLIVLYFRAEKKAYWDKQMVKDWEIELDRFFSQEYNTTRLNVFTFSPTIVEKEIVQAGDSLRPFMFVGFAIMTSFCSITTIISGVTVYNQKATIRKVILSVIACINSFMACGCAFGIMFICGVPFSPLLCITPFLVLAISVDDSFLMIHAWNRLVLSEEKLTRKQAIAEVLVQTGAAITISALTNILSFVVGVLTSPPEIRIFCIGNAACIVMDVLFQATFFTAAMFLLADEPIDTNYEKSVGKAVRKHTNKLAKQYVSCWTKPLFSYGCFFLWIMYVAGAIYGLCQVNVDLSSDKMFLPDSSIIEIDRMRSRSVVPFYYPAMIVINNPGDLQNKSRIEELIKMKEGFEQLDNAIGPESTKFFLNDYVEFLDSMPEDGSEDEEDGVALSPIDDFLSWPEYSFWKGFISIRTRSVKTSMGNTTSERYVDKFMFSTGYHGKELKSWSAQGVLLKKWRNEIDKHPELNASVFTDAAFYLDVLEQIPSNTFQSVVITFICVIIVCMLFISHPTTVFVVSSAILSTCLGVFGYLSLFGISLDPVMMSISIMCIGFSVDIPAHVSFHFFATNSQDANSTDLSIKSKSDEEKEDLEHKLTHTLCAVGFPVMQAGISTDLCTLPLLFVNLYMAKVFAWSLMFCVTLSLIHGLVFIPLLFSMKYHLTQAFSKIRCCRN